MTTIQAIKSKIAETKTAIETQLFLGADTQSLRATLIELEKQLADAEQAEVAAERERQQAESEQADQRVAEALDSAHSDVVAAAGDDVVAGVQMPVIDVDPAVANATASLTAARDRLAREEATYQSHNGKYITLKSRLNDKERTRDEILARRVTGDEKAGDAAEVALLAEDISSLKELVAEAHRNAEQYRPATARRLVTEAEQALSKVHATAVFNAKQARLLELERAFVAAHAELVQACNTVGINKFQAFKASPELRMIAYGTPNY
ncbi:TPA: hypothetical protein R2K55_005776 [Raoultella ornithinolytica]|uniref:hypothetical protein n=1 Tax=Raoultella ornithinolytica TaxID=54291 RepID=UPI00273DE2C9|nr:hypothetical protein [Raoultella ornithinolytica]WLP46285.1 hypothetical protein Q7A27_00270 [Raoultella ornithinolytica]HEC2553941.1 hypothetical protein [Raoultella ornithinolytica]HEC2606746.1 hypothetical protein [Raoultella ornithinolytica]HEC2611326.1 hypothetical protein [Raoultella ornithinolytica]